MKILQVAEFIEIVNGILRETLSGEVFAVEGEVSGYRVSQGQWVTFDLKDDKSLVNVFMPIWQLTVPLEDGIRVRVFGLPRVYPKYGKFSISAERIELAGEGALRKALIQLREKLAKEGLFDPTRKRELPKYPNRIALIASRDSAAYGDFVRIAGERWGGLEIDLYHVPVQGDKAPREIVAAIENAQSGEYDVLVMTRGGGSFDDLMAFNDERVARAIHASGIPTMVAIGHERDLTLAEEAADVRGSTPTDCARRLVPDRKDVLFELATGVGTIQDSMNKIIMDWHQVIERSLSLPAVWLTVRQNELANLFVRNTESANNWLRGLHGILESSNRLFSSFDHKNVLKRGYAMLKAGSKYATSVNQLKTGERVDMVLKDGEAGADIVWIKSRLI
ncbi:MAG: exodeoxyribonuclease VII large subunit [Patescibacteria group bacterium]